ncbi:MAG: zinc ABC transporter substrate-binding protein [Synergistaceae bacterium]|nr:zinc ABC transporter substrate-binding protein [Synergistaceae bacterium]
MFRVFYLILFVFSMPLFPPAAAGVNQISDEKHPMRVFTTVAPLSWFISSVAGDMASVSVLVPAGAEAHVYEPKPEQMAALSSAGIYFAIGNFSPFEASRLPKFAEQNPSLMIVRLDEGLDEEHNGHDEHGHDGHDPHIWTSVSSAPQILKNILDAFTEADPQNAELYNKNYLRALDEIKELDSFIRNKFHGCGGKSFIVYHPAWGRFAEDLGVQQMAVEHEGKEPKINMLATLMNTARAKGIKTVFAAPSDPQRNVGIFADEIGADVVIIDPLAPDWLQNIYAAAEKIYKALK